MVRRIAILLVMSGIAACMPVADGGPDRPYVAGSQPGYPQLGAALPAGHTRYENASLAALFVRLTHDLEWGARRPNLVRYEQPVSVGVTGPTAVQYLPFLDRFLGELRAQTGISIARTPAQHNLWIHFVPGQEFRRKLPQHFCVVAPGRLGWDEFRRNPVRFGTRAYERLTMLDAMSVYIPDNLEPFLVRLCLIEETVQALGPANDLYGLGPSIFNDDAAHIWPTKLDYLMLRVLYAREMRTGMDRRETMSRARRVLARLNPAGQSAPALPPLRTQAFREWSELVRRRDVASRREALALARTKAPASAHHCHSLVALARLLRDQPARVIEVLERAIPICTAAHGPDDIRLALITLERARATFKSGRPELAYKMTERLESSLAAHGQDERLLSLYDLQAASLQAIQQGTKSFEARRRAAEWGAYSLGRDHTDVRRLHSR